MDHLLARGSTKPQTKHARLPEQLLILAKDGSIPRGLGGCKKIIFFLYLKVVLRSPFNEIIIFVATVLYLLRSECFINSDLGIVCL